MGGPWPPELDGIAAAPGHHRVLFENDAVRVVETVVRAGDHTPLHTHPSTVMYVVSGSHFIRKDDAGMVTTDTRESGGLEPGSVLWSDGTPPHTIENPTDDDLVVIGVELKLRDGAQS
jgi:mannose-6-phosphate isomerase-like protein (cupin superfamily)